MQKFRIALLNRVVKNIKIDRDKLSIEKKQLIGDESRWLIDYTRGYAYKIPGNWEQYNSEYHCYELDLEDLTDKAIRYLMARQNWSMTIEEFWEYQSSLA